MNFFGREVNKQMEQAIYRFLVQKLASSRFFQQFAVTTHLLARHAKDQGTKTIQEALKKASSTYSTPTQYFSSSSSTSSYNSYSQQFNSQKTFQAFQNTFVAQFISKMRRNLTKMIKK